LQSFNSLTIIHSSIVCLFVEKAIKGNCTQAAESILQYYNILRFRLCNFFTNNSQREQEIEKTLCLQI